MIISFSFLFLVSPPCLVVSLLPPLFLAIVERKEELSQTCVNRLGSVFSAVMSRPTCHDWCWEFIDR